MNKEKAIQTLVQALEAAAKAGVFTLSDSVNIVNAINKVSELVEIVPSEE